MGAEVATGDGIRDALLMCKHSEEAIGLRLSLDAIDDDDALDIRDPLENDTPSVVALPTSMSALVPLPLLLWHGARGGEAGANEEAAFQDECSIACFRVHVVVGGVWDPSEWKMRSRWSEA